MTLPALSSEGCMILLAVERVVLRSQRGHGPDFFMMYGKGWQFGVTRLHAFTGLRDGSSIILTADQVEPGDRLWIDQSAFMADGSLTERRR